MRETRLMMGMPITIEVPGSDGSAAIAAAFDWFQAVDRRFSPYKPTSEVSALNRGDIAPEHASDEMREVLALAETTRWETRGFFDIRRPDGTIDPSGLVKGWAIRKAAQLIAGAGHADYCVEAGGDIQCAGGNGRGEPWRIGIRNPFNPGESVKTLQPGDAGVATSGSYVRGAHIYDPHAPESELSEIVGITVVARDIYDADRFATAAFAMGPEGIAFIDATDGLEGYAIDRHGVATMSRGFSRVVAPC